MTTTAKLIQNIQNRKTTFVTADGTTTKTLFTASTNNSNCIRIIISNDDSVSRYVAFYLAIDGTDVPIGSVFVNAGAGVTAGSVPTDALSYYLANNIIYDNYGNKIIKLGKDSAASTVALKCAMVTAVTAAKTFYVSAIFGDY